MSAKASSFTTLVILNIGYIGIWPFLLLALIFWLFYRDITLHRGPCLENQVEYRASQPVSRGPSPFSLTLLSTELLSWSIELALIINVNCTCTSKCNKALVALYTHYMAHPLGAATTSDSDKDLGRNIPYLFVRVTLWIVDIVVNVFILLPSIFNQSFRQDPFKNLLAQLALGDIFIATGACARHYLNYKEEHHLSWQTCSLVDVFQLIGLHLGQGAMFLIAMDRFIAIYNPLAYQNMAKKRTIIIRWATSVTIAVGNSLFLLIRPHTKDNFKLCRMSSDWPQWFLIYIFSSGVLICVLVIAFSVTAVICAKKRLRIQSDYHRRVFYTFVYIISTYVLCWILPKVAFFGLTQIRSFGPMITTLQWHINGITDTIMGIANFVIYGWRHREVRKAAAAIFRRRGHVSVVRMVRTSNSHVE
uniref:G_PROTEIN_RECEP_F1_2 domain-containing protein n=1 Tax=Steinernema glaseri TaxID=37863 RepID=A0A1I7YM97_9BILA